MTMDFSDMASQDGNGSSRRRKLEKIPEQDKSEGEVEDYESEEDDQEDDGWITHDVNEYIIVHAWQGHMRNTNIDNRVYELEFRYYLKDNSVWFILNGGRQTKNVDKFPEDAYQTAIKRWEELRANYTSLMLNITSILLHVCYCKDASSCILSFCSMLILREDFALL
jgi:hypothetical protein